MNFTVFVIGWLSAGVLNLGYWSAAMKSKFPQGWNGNREILSYAPLWVVSGAVGLIVTLLMGNCRYGWLIWDKSDDKNDEPR